MINIVLFFLKGMERKQIQLLIVCPFTIQLKSKFISKFFIFKLYNSFYMKNYIVQQKVFSRENQVLMDLRRSYNPFLKGVKKFLCSTNWLVKIKRIQLIFRPSHTYFIVSICHGLQFLLITCLAREIIICAVLLLNTRGTQRPH